MVTQEKIKTLRQWLDGNSKSLTEEVVAIIEDMCRAYELRYEFYKPKKK